MLLGHAGEQGTSTEEVGRTPGDENIIFSALWCIVLAASPVAFMAVISLCTALDQSARLPACWSRHWEIACTKEGGPGSVRG